jgi:hypothetical protein
VNGHEESQFGTPTNQPQALMTHIETQSEFPRNHNLKHQPLLLKTLLLIEIPISNLAFVKHYQNPNTGENPLGFNVITYNTQNLMSQVLDNEKFSLICFPPL